MESQYGAMNEQHSLPDSITTYIPKFQNNKQGTHTIIVQLTLIVRYFILCKVPIKIIVI
jgi:hypothetical protein